MEAITLINNYKALFNTPEKRIKNASLIKTLIKQARQIKFNNLDFPESTDDYQLHLGYDGLDLYGILIKSNKNVFFGNTITSKTIVSKFDKIDYIVPGNLVTRLENATEITFDEVIKRRGNIDFNYEELINTCLKNNQMVEYFIIDKSNFQSTGNTSIITAVYDQENKGALRFDLITVNVAYMDTVRPVPPFRP